jgi:hypothetical protein
MFRKLLALRSRSRYRAWHEPRPVVQYLGWILRGDAADRNIPRVSLSLSRPWAAGLRNHEIRPQGSACVV